MVGWNSVRTASGKLRKDFELLKDEMRNNQKMLNETRKELEELKKIVYEMQTATGEEGRKNMEAKVQRLETTIERLDKQDLIQRLTRLEEICGKIDEDLSVVQQRIRIVSENQNAAVERSFVADRNALNKPNESQQEETTSADPVQRDTIQMDRQNQRYREALIRPLLDGRLILHKLLLAKFVILMFISPMRMFSVHEIPK